MKIAHNKKRNTFFIYEALVREYTKAKMEKDKALQLEVQAILKEFFSEGKVLREEIRVYRAVTTINNIGKELAEKILFESKRIYMGLDPSHIFQQQSSLIAKANRKLTPNFFNNYVPNYKSIATLQQIFNQKSDISTRMLLERQIVNKMVSAKETEIEASEKIDKYVLHSFLNSFNKKYGDLLENQKALLKRYLVATEEDNIDFMVFLSEELSSIQAKLNSPETMKEIGQDSEMKKKLNEVKRKFESLNKEEIDEKFLQNVLKFQKLAYELEN